MEMATTQPPPRDLGKEQTWGMITRPDALVEIENIHDDGLEFAPIHRVLFDLKKDVLAEMQDYFGSNYQFTPTPDLQTMTETVECWCENKQAFGIISEVVTGFVEIANPRSNLAVGTCKLPGCFQEEGGAKRSITCGFDTVSGSEDRRNTGFLCRA
jgi:hypothetical protein